MKRGILILATISLLLPKLARGQEPSFGRFCKESSQPEMVGLIRNGGSNEYCALSMEGMRIAFARTFPT